METSVKIFSNPIFGDIRTAISKNGEPMFAAVDICKILGYANTSKAITDHTEEEERYNESLERGGSMLFVNESGLYSLIIRSNKSEAKLFRKWVTSEVLPTIRKHGGYLTPEKVEEVLLNPDTIIQLATQLKNERERNRLLEACNRDNVQRIKEQEPKSRFADAVATSNRSCLVAELAKIINQNGVEMGQNRLFQWMRSNGYLGSKGEYYNQPTQKSMDMGLFEIKKTAISKPDGSVLVNVTSKVTGKGQIYFVNKFLR